MNGDESYALSKSLVASVAAGISNYNISDSGLLTFETSDGETLSYQFREPADGVSITDVSINANKHLIITYSDGVVEDAGLFPTEKGDPGYSPKITVKTDTTTEYVLHVKTADDEYDTPNLKGGGSGGGGSLEDDLTTSITVGGITSGTFYDEGTGLEKILRDMLNPVAYPTLTNPSASLSATGAKLLEKGSTLNTTFTLTFNRGSINPQYSAESPYRSGAATAYVFDGETKTTNTFARTITEAKTSYQGSVSYAAGVQPKDSEGKNYNSPLPAGSVNSNTVSYEFVDALWANTTNITTIAKLALVSKSTKQKDFAFPPQTVANPEAFDVPASWTVTAVQVKNDLSGVYEDAMSQFTVTDTTHNDAAGNSVAYKRYSFNLGYDTGARSVRLKWS